MSTRLPILALVASVAMAPLATGQDAPAAAQVEQAGPEQAAPAEERPVEGLDGRRTVRRLPQNIGRGMVGVVHLDNFLPLVAGATATGIATLLDDEIRDQLAEDTEWGETLEDAGGPVYSSVFVAGMFAAGRLTGDLRFRAMTYDMLDVSVVNAAYSLAIKAAAGRTRPNGENDQSFPSGHTSNAFALATVAERHYGWKAGVPAYAAAGLMGLSRMKQNKHWLSDVCAGAALGYITGRTVSRVNGPAIPGPRTTWTVSPVVARQARGLQVSVAF